MIRVTKKIFSILNKSQKAKTVILAFMMLIGGVMESLSISLMLPLITAIMDTDNWQQRRYTQILCSIFHISEQRSFIVLLLVILIVVFLIKNIYLIFQYYAQYSFIAGSRYQMQRQLMASFIRKPYTYYLNSSSGEILRIISSDTGQAFSILTQLLIFYSEIVVCVILGITIIIMSPEIAIGLIIILGIEMIVIAKIIKPIMKKEGDRARFEGSLAYKWLLQSVNGIKSIKVANTEKFFEENYNVHAWKLVDLDRKNQTLSNLPRMLIEAFTMSGVLLILLVMVLAGSNLVMLVPQLSAFVVGVVRILPSTNRISSAINQIPFWEGGLDNIITVLKEEAVNEAFSEKVNAVNIHFSKKLELQNVTFEYPNSNMKILDCVDLQIVPGQSIGIIGASGAGKTTLIDIILGLLKPLHGYVKVDDTDIELNMHSWLRHLAYIPQQIFLMDDSIRNNVAFGRKPDEIDTEAVWAALKEAQMDDFVRNMPEGMNTVIGEQGIRLSGGQRQRIGIARALYDKPDILFLDEATSALDHETEAAIMESVSHLKGKITMIIIAHRLSTIKNCDVVYRVENGKIIEENIKKNGDFE